jgi:hypothetical protein
MTGKKAKHYMPELFESITQPTQYSNVLVSQNDAIFVTADVSDVVIDGILYTHYPEIKYFCSSKNLKEVNDSEYSTRCSMLNLKYIDNEISYIDESSHYLEHMLKTMRMF